MSLVSRMYILSYTQVAIDCVVNGIDVPVKIPFVLCNWYVDNILGEVSCYCPKHKRTRASRWLHRSFSSLFFSEQIIFIE